DPWSQSAGIDPPFEPHYRACSNTVYIVSLILFCLSDFCVNRALQLVMKSSSTSGCLTITCTSSASYALCRHSECSHAFNLCCPFTLTYRKFHLIHDS